MKARVDEVITLLDWNKMSMEEQRFINAQVKKELEKIDREFKELEQEYQKREQEKEISNVKFMFSQGISPEKISIGINMPLNRVKAILAM